MPPAFLFRPTHACSTLVARVSRRRIRLLVVRPEGERLVRRPGDPAFTLHRLSNAEYAGQGWHGFLTAGFTAGCLDLVVRADGTQRAHHLWPYYRPRFRYRGEPA